MFCAQPQLNAEQFASYGVLGRPFLIAFINLDQLSVAESGLMSVMEKIAANNGPLDGKCVCAWMDVYVSVQFSTNIYNVQYNVTSALEVFLNDMRYINSRFTYLLTKAGCHIVPQFARKPICFEFTPEAAVDDILIA